MKKILYIYTDKSKNEILFSGISFLEFIQYINPPINNILLLKAECMGNRFFKNFEIIEGAKNVYQLAKNTSLYQYGDFCFIDFPRFENIEQIANQEIAELLYIGHMFTPMKEPFYKDIDNRFVYLSHDNDYRCKLYCRNLIDFIKVIGAKISEDVLDESMSFSDHINHEILLLSEQGLLIDLGDVKRSKETSSLKLYSVGKYTDIDELLNKRAILKQRSVSKNLFYREGTWSIIDRGDEKP